MIFVTVGTHEQPFNRLVQKIDELKGNGELGDNPVMIQLGYSTYRPQYCEWKEFLPYDEMKHYVQVADIVITHGGPSSFFMPLQVGKIPVVVPRQERFAEHVNNHQLDFSRQVQKRYHNIIVVEDIEKLGYVLQNYQELVLDLTGGDIHVPSNNARFCEQFGKIVDDLFHR